MTASFPSDPVACNALAWDLLDRGDVAGAHEALQAALRLAPNDPQTLVNLAGVFRMQGRLRDAVLHCDAAIAAAPYYADAWLERGYVLASGGSLAAAADCYRQVLAIEPDHAPAHAGLAAYAAREGDHTTGRAHAEAALAKDPHNAIAATALATIELEAGDPARARDLLEAQLPTLPEPTTERSQLLGQLGDAYARLGEPARAHDAYARAKSDFATIQAGVLADRSAPVRLIDSITAGVAAMTPQTWPADTPARPANAADRHVFLLGYPRSGNTLCENILASIDGVLAIEERPTFAAADSAFLAQPDGLARLSALTPGEVDLYRRAYWDKVASAGYDVQGQCLVDMDPLKSLRLPLIARLFPEARVIVMRRDPRDVVWSCFRTNFALSNAAIAFTTLESTARHYDAVMRLTDKAISSLPLQVQVVRYDRLVGDFEATTRAMCDFAGLPWSEDLVRFDRTARKRGVSTASAAQVRKPLYDGTRQWEPYAAYLADVMPILQPWIERFGY